MGALVSCFSAAEEALIHEQALAALLAQQNGGALPFDRSSSLRYPGHGQKKQALQRSSSWRARSLTDPVVQPQHFVNQQDLKIDNLETNHFVLIHGGGFGAWCWYKTKALLEDWGFKVNAIDLTGSGIHSFDTNKITTLPEYVQPLTSFLEALGDGEKVILVGHDFGGACISYAMEMFPSKIATAVFLCAAMLTSDQSTLDMFSQQATSRGVLAGEEGSRLVGWGSSSERERRTAGLVRSSEPLGSSGLRVWFDPANRWAAVGCRFVSVQRTVGQQWAAGLFRFSSEPVGCMFVSVQVVNPVWFGPSEPVCAAVNQFFGSFQFCCCWFRGG